jgi:hypothetical protein
MWPVLNEFLNCPLHQQSHVVKTPKNYPSMSPSAARRTTIEYQVGNQLFIWANIDRIVWNHGARQALLPLVSSAKNYPCRNSTGCRYSILTKGSVMKSCDLQIATSYQCVKQLTVRLCVYPGDLEDPESSVTSDSSQNHQIP